MAVNSTLPCTSRKNYDLPLESQAFCRMFRQHQLRIIINIISMRMRQIFTEFSEIVYSPYSSVFDDTINCSVSSSSSCMFISVLAKSLWLPLLSCSLSTFCQFVQKILTDGGHYTMWQLGRQADSRLS